MIVCLALLNHAGFKTMLICIIQVGDVDGWVEVYNCYRWINDLVDVIGMLILVALNRGQ